MDALTALRRALHARLVADAALTGLIAGRVHDEVPRAPHFPFLTLGEARLADASVGQGPLVEHTLTLHVWSQQGGQAEAQALSGAVIACLDEAALALTGHSLIALRFLTADLRRESDGRSHHAVLRFRALTSPNL